MGSCKTFARDFLFALLQAKETPSLLNLKRTMESPSAHMIVVLLMTEIKVEMLVASLQFGKVHLLVERLIHGS